MAQVVIEGYIEMKGKKEVRCPFCQKWMSGGYIMWHPERGALCYSCFQEGKRLGAKAASGRTCCTDGWCEQCSSLPQGVAKRERNYR